MKETNLDFDEYIERRNTDCLKYDFAVRRGKPADVLPLWVADMDFRAPSTVLTKIKERVDHGIFGYTEPRDDYYNTVIDWFKRHHDLTVERSQIFTTPGIVYAIALAIRAFSKEGEAVLIQQPVYYPFSELVRDNNRKLVSNDLYLGKDGKYHIDFEDFEKKIKENHVKLFVLCSPHNPVGRVWNYEELERIIDICYENQVIIFSDEIHCDFTFSKNKHISLYNVKEEAKEIGIVATSPAKTFNLAGVQISNIFVANSDLRYKLRKEKAASGYSQPNTIGATACEAAYKYGEEWYEALLKYLEGNLEFVRNYLEENLPQVKLIEPEGTYLIWLDFRGLNLCLKDLEDLIVNKAKLWLDSGEIFGKIGEGFQRINIATNRAILKEALERIRKAVKELE